MTTSNYLGLQKGSRWQGMGEGREAWPSNLQDALLRLLTCMQVSLERTTPCHITLSYHSFAGGCSGLFNQHIAHEHAFMLAVALKVWLLTHVHAANALHVALLQKDVRIDECIFGEDLRTGDCLLNTTAQGTVLHLHR
jgi:hypothetical protein